MTQIEKLRKAKLQPRWTVWAWQVGAVLTFVALLLEISDGNTGIGAMFAAVYAIFISRYYAASQAELHKELLREIDDLRARMRR